MNAFTHPYMTHIHIMRVYPNIGPPIRLSVRLAHRVSGPIIGDYVPAVILQRIGVPSFDASKAQFTDPVFSSAFETRTEFEEWRKPTWTRTRTRTRT